MTISSSNSFDLFSYGSESVFWYFQFQGLISDFSDNPLNLHKFPCRGPQINGQKATFLENGRHMSLIEFWGKMGPHSYKIFKGKKAKKKW